MPFFYTDDVDIRRVVDGNGKKAWVISRYDSILTMRLYLVSFGPGYTFPREYRATPLIGLASKFRTHWGARWVIRHLKSLKWREA